MMRRYFAAGTVVLAAAVFIGSPHAGAAPDPAAFVNNLGTQAIQVLGPTVPAPQRLARFRELFRDDFDIQGIGRFVLGRYWRIASAEEQQEFLKLFQEYVVQAYSARLAAYGGEPFRVIGTRTSGDDVVVTSQVVRQKGGPVAVDWHLIDSGGQFKITDVYVGGVSMKVTERDEFGAVIQRNGGRVAALLVQLRQKIGAEN